MASLVAQEGFIPVVGGRVWYQIVGTGNAIPLLTIHGGPGVPHDYLESLAVLADERPVIYYDQLGCGKSDRPDDVTLWQLERFVEELRQVRAALQFEHVHLFGHSLGTMLAMDYVLTYPLGITSLILASPILSLARHLADRQRLRSQLPKEVQDTLDYHEAAGTIADEAYQMALQVFFQRHLSLLDSPPESSVRAAAGFNSVVSETMWGSNEFVVTGNLRSYERTNRLAELTIPTLFTCGRHDLTTPETTSWYQSLVPTSEIVVFEASAHGPHDEEPEHYIQTVRAFLHRAEQRAL